MENCTNKTDRASLWLVSEVLSIARSCWRNMPRVEVYESSSLEYLGVNTIQFALLLNKKYNLLLTESEVKKCGTVYDVANLVAKKLHSSSKKENGTTNKKSTKSYTEKKETLNTKDDIENAYRNFSNMLEKSRNAISSLATINPNFTSHQEEYRKQLEKQIARSEVALAEMQRYAIWDKLVIAFIGVTNAGKSTIIETFRILFDEIERKKAFKKCPSGVDGEIIGDGRADFTKTYKEYNMSIGGRDFVLIDVPGIEGNEGAVKSEILKALSKAHCVFYVQGEGKKPDSATVEKIKEFLKDWVKVYSIYNVKGSSFNYDDEEEREIFKNNDISKVEREISKTMQDTLGENYAGNITIQARLALCANAKFARNQKELIDEQRELIESFGTSESMFTFSNFSELTKNVDYLSSHFTDEILEAQKKKLYKLHVEAFKDLSNLNQAHINEIDRIIKKFRNCSSNVKRCYNSSENIIKAQLRQEITEMFDILEKDGCHMIDAGLEGDDLKREISQDQKRLSEIVEYNFGVIISNESKDLKKNVEREIERLKDSICITTVNGKFSTNFDMDLSKVVGELEFGLGDLFNWGAYLGGMIAAGWLIGMNFWNPIGWITGIAALVTFIFGDSKEDKAKKELRKSLSEAKNDFFITKWSDITYKIDFQLESKLEDFDNKIKKIIRDFNTLKSQMESVMRDIRNNSSKFK